MAIAISIATGACLGVEAMVNTLVIGGFFSFVCAKAVDGLALQPRRVAFLLPMSRNASLCRATVRPQHDCARDEKEALKQVC